MKILKYKDNFLYQCRSLWEEMVFHHRGIYNDPSIGGETPGLEFDEHLSRIGSDNMWVAKSKNTMMGLMGLIINNQEAEVEPVIVASGFRGQGIGKALLQHAVKAAKELGVLCVSVKPVARNIGAISFFHGAGFTNLGHIQMFMWLGSSEPEAWKPGPTLFGKTFYF
jgi:GNAT superfamily N-acetyltransferase